MGTRIAVVDPAATSVGSLLSPHSPQKAARRLDEALNGPPRDNPLMARRRSRDFQGEVQAPSFWVSTRSASFNPLERRVEGLLVSLGGSTEVRLTLRSRPAATAAVLGGAGAIAAYSIVAVPVGLAAHAVPILGVVAGALLISVAVALWVIFAASVVAGRRMGRAAEQRTRSFVAAVLDEVGPDLGSLR